ncbi:hypothetical protein VOLCADRAFT_81996 [Volvox carteri f. nagariensis]|uniref:Pirin-like protein n=1 Tax=Volvox carteri f. nagariensis TaxID=3068 RepID=D8U2D8_VOLCA|nr:uncharacterized protein VOLCADRAFT_81996 [Volvox carteri f. nagariensis]EFJ46046.1 hypothetical protein VOLCADRAFT_81996 [Volvox carteri f. nagariensis]|eukprot:XP_002952796.1 hypothetical protein VOLCADRAFT_81996 [Volvox carteri f. nagariensis]
MAAAALNSLRPVTKVVQGQKMKEGAGVTICRTVGTSGLRNLDPYLMLDELKLPAKAAFAGFPDHPHRGFETCSIMLEGQMEHRDSHGNHGVIGPGGVQWMTAGRGIIHSEMPKSTDGMLWGFQLWINLPKKDKMCKPRYQDYQRSDIPVVESSPGASVRVMAGSHGGAIGPIKMRNPGLLMDVRLAPGASFTQEVPLGWNGFAYVYDGEGRICGTRAQPEHVSAWVDGNGGVGGIAGVSGQLVRFLLIAGKPIGEPIVQHGPFVMNTEEEIYQAS